MAPCFNCYSKDLKSNPKGTSIGTALCICSFNSFFEVTHLLFHRHLWAKVYSLSKCLLILNWLLLWLDHHVSSSVFPYKCIFLKFMIFWYNYTLYGFFNYRSRPIGSCNVSLWYSVTEKTAAPDSKTPLHTYDIFGASCVEVEFDALTGSYIISRMDVLYDCGVRCVSWVVKYLICLA